MLINLKHLHLILIITDNKYLYDYLQSYISLLEITCIFGQLSKHL